MVPMFFQGPFCLFPNALFIAYPSSRVLIVQEKTAPSHHDFIHQIAGFRGLLAAIWMGTPIGMARPPFPSSPHKHVPKNS